MNQLETFKPNNEKGVPNFRHRFDATRWAIPLRAYFHNSGLDRAFSNSILSTENRAISHLSDICDERKNGGLALSRFNYTLAFVWGNEHEKMVDLFGFSDIDYSDNPKIWPGNPNIEGYIFRNGVYVPETRDMTCGDGLIILGIEERHRRTKRNLREYLENPPKIEGLDSL